MALQMGEDEDDLIVPEVSGEIPKEWQDKWWMEKLRHLICSEILNLFQ